MPYRNQLPASAAQDPQHLLTIWRQERAFRVGKALCYSAFFLTMVATIADFVWSDVSVIATDFILLIGCAISLYWIRSPTRPHYYWLPLFVSFWISSLPSFWTTGGLDSPFFGLGLATLYVIGAVLDSKNRSFIYMFFAFLHIPTFLVIELYHPLSPNPTLPAIFTSIPTGAILGALFVCVHGLLRTERELSLEFAEHYRNLSKTEDDLKKREGQLREAQSIASMGSWEWDLEADRISWSDELFKIFEISKKNFDPSFKAYLQRLSNEMRDKIQKIIKQSLETGSDFAFENNIQTSKGERVISSRGRVISDSNGRAIKMLGTSQDITERKHIESQLMEARNELEQRVEERTLQLAQSLEREKSAKKQAESANLAKMQFLANMSHEIRTPMNSILGFSELLDTEAHNPEETKEYLSRIRTNGKQLLHLIDDILDLSKFEAGRIPVQKKTFSIKSLVEEVVNSFLPALKAKGLDLQIDTKIDTPEFVCTDANRVSQVLTNLLSNSIKFSDKGMILVTVTTKAHSLPHRSYLTIDIEDAGVGISPENQKTLFQPFNQGDSSVARRFGGSGLGLALSKRIAEALGGKLELMKSTHGQGSHFSFQIPIDQDSLEKPAPPRGASIENCIENKRFDNKNILLVEDSPDNAVLICHYIKALGAHIDIATDGLQAVQNVQKCQYDCILMDIQMPGMDGLEATRRIRSYGYTKPIIALTAHALPAEAERSLEAGCNLHLTKPISKAELIHSLSEQLSMQND